MQHFLRTPVDKGPKSRWPYSLPEVLEPGMIIMLSSKTTHREHVG